MKLNFLFAMIIGFALMEFAEVHAQEERGSIYSPGDCLIGGQSTSCQSYLTKLGNAEGFDYLSNVACPGCVESETETPGPDGTTLRQLVCRTKPNGDAYQFGKPDFDNLNTANPSHSHATSGQTGAVVTGYQERECWKGGLCLPIGCVQGLGKFDPINGRPVVTYECQKSSIRVRYYVKIFGNTCSPDDVADSDEEYYDDTYDDSNDGSNEDTYEGSHEDTYDESNEDMYADSNEDLHEDTANYY